MLETKVENVRYNMTPLKHCLKSLFHACWSMSLILYIALTGLHEMLEKKQAIRQAHCARRRSVSRDTKVIKDETQCNLKIKQTFQHITEHL